MRQQILDELDVVRRAGAMEGRGAARAGRDLPRFASAGGRTSAGWGRRPSPPAAAPVPCRRWLLGVLSVPRLRNAAAPAHVGIFDRHMQRRLAVDVPLVHVGAGFDQALRDIPVAVHHRQRQRRDAIGIRQLDVAPCAAAARRRRPCSSRARRRAAASGRRCACSCSAARRVMWRSKLRTMARAFTSAPFDASSFTISGWRRAAAHISAVWPPNCFRGIHVGAALDAAAWRRRHCRCAPRSSARSGLRRWAIPHRHPRPAAA